MLLHQISYIKYQSKEVSLKFSKCIGMASWMVVMLCSPLLLVTRTCHTQLAPQKPHVYLMIGTHCQKHDSSCNLWHLPREYMTSVVVVAKQRCVCRVSCTFHLFVTHPLNPINRTCKILSLCYMCIYMYVYNMKRKRSEKNNNCYQNQSIHKWPCVVQQLGITCNIYDFVTQSTCIL